MRHSRDSARVGSADDEERVLAGQHEQQRDVAVPTRGQVRWQSRLPIHQPKSKRAVYDTQVRPLCVNFKMLGERE